MEKLPTRLIDVLIAYFEDLLTSGIIKTPLAKKDAKNILKNLKQLRKK